MKTLGLRLLWLLVAGAASAQTLAAPDSTAAPAPPDTLVARFSWAESGPEPGALFVVPGQAVLGEVVAVVLDLNEGTVPPAKDLRVDADWLEAAPGAPLPELEDLPASSGRRLVVPFRAYRLGPWRAAWGESAPGPVLEIVGRLQAGAGLVSVRDPRRLGGLPAWVLALAAVLLAVALALLLWWRWRRRPAAVGAADLPLPPPAWLRAATELWSLEEAHGHDRAYLDGLAAVLRRYLHGRYHLPAEEMTAAEIAAAAERTGWPADRLGAFAGILAGCDQARYAPAGVSGAQCREGMQRLLDLIEAERIEPVWTPVPATLRSEAGAAWARLRERYPLRQEVGSC
jgi:hypothetical protein